MRHNNITIPFLDGNTTLYITIWFFAVFGGMDSANDPFNPCRPSRVWWRWRDIRNIGNKPGNQQLASFPKPGNQRLTQDPRNESGRVGTAKAATGPRPGGPTLAERGRPRNVKEQAARAVIGQSWLVGTPRCGVRTAQRAVPAFSEPPSLTDYRERPINIL
jgi:hypothetical protein